MTDPFSEDNDILCNIATGVVLPEEVADRLVRSKEEGLMQLDCFVQQCLHCNSVRIPSSNEKSVVAAEDRDRFGRLLIIANVREVNLR